MNTSDYLFCTRCGSQQLAPWKTLPDGVRRIRLMTCACGGALLDESFGMHDDLELRRTRSHAIRAEFDKRLKAVPVEHVEISDEVARAILSRDDEDTPDPCAMARREGMSQAALICGKRADEQDPRKGAEACLRQDEAAQCEAAILAAMERLP